MAKIKLILPNKKIFSTTIKVRITDINYGNHIGNDSFVGIVHEARLQWLVQNNYSELNIGNAGLIMAALAVEFKAEGFYKDEIVVDIFCGDITTAGFELYYQLTTKRGDKEIILANAKTDMVCFDYEKRKVTALPEEFVAILT
jgi:acyl-CoA thioester hydrolase